MSEDKIKVAILEAAEEANEMISSQGFKIDTEDWTKPLLGHQVDSLGLVTFVGVLELKLEAALKHPVSLTDAKAFAGAKSPFVSLNALCEHAEAVCGLSS